MKALVLLELLMRNNIRGTGSPAHSVCVCVNIVVQLVEDRHFKIVFV